MYLIGNIIYGIPINEKIADLIEKNKKKYAKLFEILYHGASDRHVGYCGVLLKEFDECNDFIKLEDLIIKPTNQELLEVESLIDKLPTEIQAVMDSVDTYIVWSTS